MWMWGMGVGVWVWEWGWFVWLFRGMDSERCERYTLTAGTAGHSMTRYMDSYMYALSTSWLETLLQAAHAVKPAL